MAVELEIDVQVLKSEIEDTRRKAQKFGARGTTVKAYEPGP
jgi:hypothetical protein